MNVNSTEQPSAPADGQITPQDGLLSRSSEMEGLEPERIIAAALEAYSPQIGIAFSGAEDVVLIHIAAQTKRAFRVFMLDTGRLHPETYEFVERVREKYGVAIESFAPDHASIERLVREKGLFSFYREGHSECCSIRKVEPLRRALAPLAAWITGQRRDQSPQTRARLPVVQPDTTFAGPDHALVKVNPLAAWSSAQVWDYIRAHEVPYNKLHTLGLKSIGCQPCTRATLPGEHERAGRWWWEDETRKECGLHAGNVQPSPEAVAHSDHSAGNGSRSNSGRPQ